MNLDILKVSGLGNAPIQCSKRRVCWDIGCVENNVLETDSKRQLALLVGRRVLAGEENPVAGEAWRRFENGGLWT